MVLPLVDGAYFSILLTNQLETVFSSIIIGFSVLSGIASISMAQKIKGCQREKVKKLIYVIIVFLIALVITTILARTISNYINIQLLRKFAGISVLIIAIKLIDKEIILKKLSKVINPSALLLIGIVLSIESIPNDISLILEKKLLINSLIAGMTAISVTTVACLVKIPDYKNLLDYLTLIILTLISLKMLGVY